MMKKPSSASAAPMDQQLEQSVQNAGISTKQSSVSHGDLMGAAEESRAQMVLPPKGYPTQKVTDTMRFRPSKTDPSGSWTGIPENPHETPVQDADDL